MKISKKEIQIILVLLSVIIMGCCYYFGYMKINEKTETIKSQNVTLKAKAEAYEMLYVNSPVYMKEQKRMEKEIASFEEQYLYGVITEDEIMYIDDVEKAQAEDSLKIHYMNMAQKAAVEYVPPVTTDPAFASGAISMPTVQGDNISLEAYGVDYGCDVSYDSFKQMIHYLNTIAGKKRIESVNLSFDSSTGLLAGTVSFNMYALTGTDHAYQQMRIPTVMMTTGNIFHTVEESKDKE